MSTRIRGVVVTALVAPLALLFAPPAQAAAPPAPDSCATAEQQYPGTVDMAMTRFNGTVNVLPGGEFSRMVWVHNCATSDGSTPVSRRVTIHVASIQQAHVVRFDTFAKNRDVSTCRVRDFTSGALNYWECTLTLTPGQSGWARAWYSVPSAPALPDRTYRGDASIRTGGHDVNGSNDRIFPGPQTRVR